MRLLIIIEGIENSILFSRITVLLSPGELSLPFPPSFHLSKALVKVSEDRRNREIAIISAGIFEGTQVRLAAQIRGNIQNIQQLELEAVTPYRAQVAKEAFYGKLPESLRAEFV